MKPPVEKKGIKVLVCGGRDYADREWAWHWLDLFHKETPFRMIVEGAATGADTLAYEWAMSRRIPCLRVPADWKTLGLKAGHARNQKMLDMVKPNRIIAFPGGAGTAGMIKIGQSNGVPVTLVNARPEGEGLPSS